jgi:DNA-binding beta-propeller fold protein YncE
MKKGKSMRFMMFALLAGSLSAQQPAPQLRFDSDPDYLKLPADMPLGEVLGIAVNSKGHIVLVNHPGSYGGPLYGAASTQLLEFDQTGKFVREIGRGVYGLGYAHSVRFDKYDNLWVVDKGTNSVMRFNPAGRVTMNLGRREEGPDEHHYVEFQRGDPPPQHVDGYFHGATDIAFDSDDNMYISDGYFNSRVAKLDKHGDWVKSWGSRGRDPGQFNLPHNIAVDRQNNVYVADRSNRRIQVFDTDGKYLRSLVLNAPYDKKRHPVLGNAPANSPDASQPWTLCITNTPTQYLYTSDQEPGRIYKLSLDGKILGVLGESGHEVGQFNWVHALACPSENTVFAADMNNWRVQKLTLHPDKSK